MKIGSVEVTNPLELIECIIAFDSKDYSTNKRDRMLYAIVFGWSDEKCKEFGWDEETIKEFNRLHERYVVLKELYNDVEVKVRKR